MQIAPRTPSEIRAELELLGAELASMLEAFELAANLEPMDQDLVALNMETRFHEITEAMTRLKSEFVESTVQRTEIPDDISSLLTRE